MFVTGHLEFGHCRSIGRPIPSKTGRMKTTVKTREINEWIIWFLKLRVVVYTVILGILVGAEDITQPAVPVGTVLLVLVIGLLLTLVFSIWVHSKRNYLPQAICQIIADLLVITAIVLLTGGSDSYFWILYFLPIAFSSVALTHLGTITTAVVSSLVHAFMLLLLQAEIIPAFSVANPSLKALVLRLILDTFALIGVGYFGGYLAENLRRKGAELVDKTDELASLMALNENIIQSMRGGLLTTDLSGVVTMLNPAGEEILGWRGTVVVGRSAGDVFPDLDFEDCIQMLSGGQRNVRLDSIFEGGSGEEKFIGISISPLLSGPETVIGYLMNFQDLTELKRLEREVRAKDRMAAVGEMAAGMAHEIRNPLASITGSVGLLQHEVSLTTDQAKLMDIVFHESQRLNRIINDFLIYSRQITYNPKRVDLSQLMDDTVTLLLNNPEVTSRHRVEARFEQRPLWCLVDPDLIRQVFWNLSHNAIRAMPEGGALTLELKKPRGREIKIQVRDTGVGIEGERIDKIFEPFHSSFENGIGLGLAIVYQIIQAHHGRIEVHSAPGKGSLFEMTLPYQEAAEGENTAGTENARPAGSVLPIH